MKSVTPTKQVCEYPLPASTQTHEIVAVPGTNLLLVSQQTNSTLVKIAVDPATGAPKRAVGHVIGSEFAGLHGLYASESRPGMVWATLQFTSQVLLLDPVAKDVNAPPKILQTFQLPVAARGPHCVIEDGATLWVTAKDADQVVRINTKAEQPFTMYAALPRPIFAALHKNAGLVYASEIKSPALLWINPKSGKTGQIEIPAAMGSAPCGLISGPDGNIWFVLLGDGTGIHHLLSCLVHGLRHQLHGGSQNRVELMPGPGVAADIWRPKCNSDRWTCTRRWPMSLQSERLHLLIQRLSLTEMMHGYEALAEQGDPDKNLPYCDFLEQVLENG